MSGVLGAARAAGPFELVLGSLLLDETLGALLAGAGPLVAMIRFSGRNGVAVLLRWTGEAGSLQQRLKAAVELSRQGPVEIVVIGGSFVVEPLLKAAAPVLPVHRVQLYHLGDDGKAFRLGGGDPGGSVLWAKLQGIEQGQIGLDSLDIAALERKLIRDAARAHESQRELGLFRARLHGAVPIVTFGLLALIAIMYGLELTLGGAESVLVLARLGALVGERVLDGEWWRLLSSSFLHGGNLHLLMNGYVLHLLGRSLEAFLGSRRFIVLYTASALGGGLASTLAGHGISVGASGALWGLLAAEGVLAFRPQGLVPTALLPQMRKGALLTLVINLGISMHPQIDLSAHLGGGLVGGVLVLTGFLTRGLPTLDVAATAEPVKRLPLLLRWASTIAVLLLLGSLVTALVLGRPWELLEEEANFERRLLSTLGISLEVPADLSGSSEPPSLPGLRQGFVGDFPLDRAKIEVQLIDGREVAEASDDRARLELALELLRTLPPAAELGNPIHEVEIGGKPGAAASYNHPQMIVERAAVIRNGRVEYVEAAYWRRYQVPFAQLAERVLSSIAPAP